MDGAIVAYLPDTDRVHYLNHTGAMIFELCNGRHTVEEIVRIIQVAFDLAAPPAPEVQALLEQAMAEGLVE